MDDGKSTLIGRLLYDSKTVYEDHLKTLKKDSARVGSAGGEIDYSLLLDGLRAEREQGITIDVAYRYFSTPRRKFIIADTPGHEQYTRNMANGGIHGGSGGHPRRRLPGHPSPDAPAFVHRRPPRHPSRGARGEQGWTLVHWSQSVFDEIAEAYTDFATRLEVSDVHIIPMSALKGDNVVEHSERMPWFQGQPPC